MREDYQEALDKMFPDGYVIYYLCPDENARVSAYNPHQIDQLEACRLTIIESRKDHEQDPE